MLVYAGRAILSAIFFPPTNNIKCGTVLRLDTYLKTRSEQALLHLFSSAKRRQAAFDTDQFLYRISGAVNVNSAL